MSLLLPTESLTERLDRWASETAEDIPLYIWPHEILEIAQMFPKGTPGEAVDVLLDGRLAWRGRHTLKVKDA